MTPKRRTTLADGQAALTDWFLRDDVDRATLATAVRFTLEELAHRAPGTSVEVRVPPFGVVQCVAGPRHTRGTPPNVVETDPQTWLLLATAGTTWAEALHQGRIRASGTRANLIEWMPLFTRDAGRLRW